MDVSLLSHRALQLGVVETFSKNAQQIIDSVEHTPCCADTVVIEFAGLLCGIPTLQDGGEARTILVVAQPAGFHHRTAERCWVLLILAGKVVLTDRFPYLVECRQRLAFRLKRLTSLAHKYPSSQRVFDDVGF